MLPELKPKAKIVYQTALHLSPVTNQALAHMLNLDPTRVRQFMTRAKRLGYNIVITSDPLTYTVRPGAIQPIPKDLPAALTLSAMLQWCNNHPISV